VGTTMGHLSARYHTPNDQPASTKHEEEPDFGEYLNEECVGPRAVGFAFVIVRRR
jgi:hypothetical protein